MSGPPCSGVAAGPPKPALAFGGRKRLCPSQVCTDDMRLLAQVYFWKLFGNSSLFFSQLEMFIT